MPKRFDTKQQAAEIAERIASRVRELRASRHLTQAGAAETLGLSTEAFGRLERAQAIPSLPTLLRLCALLDATPDDFLVPRASPAPGVRDVAEETRERRLVRELRGLPPPTRKAIEDLVHTVAGAVKKVG